MEATEPFSDELERWLHGDGDKTIGALQDVFEERSFAVAILLLMAPTALPLPTGGLTYALEITSILLALEMVAGRRTLWLPRSWHGRPLGAVLTDKAIPTVVRGIRWCERFARPRGAGLVDRSWVWRVLGLLIAALVTAAMLAPPFSGLDTLPAMGVVLLALAILLGDLLLAVVGTAVGIAGVALIVALGAAALRAVTNLW